MSNFPESLPVGWKKQLSAEKQKPYFKKLCQFLKHEYGSSVSIFPERKNILRAFKEVDFSEVKVVILGQDPYHGPSQAIGLSFGVPASVFPKPPSLKNIFKEIKSDLGIEFDESQSELSGWAEQGVLLLNTVLTVRRSQAFSHRDQGWENFTDQAIRCLNERKDPVVFILWGSAAQKKKSLITNKHHYFLESPHPSPLSAHRGFLGCRHFSRANQILESIGKKPIDWSQTVA